MNDPNHPVNAPQDSEAIERERERIVDHVEAQQDELRGGSSKDPSTRRGVTGKSLTTLVVAGAVGAILVGLVCFMFTRNPAIIIAGAACGAVLAALLSTMLFLQVEDGRVDEDVDRAEAGHATRPPT